MKQLIIFITVLFLITACSSDDIDIVDNSFVIALEPSKTEVVVDEHFTVTVHSEDEVREMWVSLNNFATGGYAFRNFGTSYVLNFNFDTLGERVISIRVKNQNNQVSEKHVTINVTRGNAIKINGVQVIAFHTMETNTYDLGVAFSKLRLSNYHESTYFHRVWYRSAIIDNGSDMIWDCSSDDLYIVSKPFSKLRFSIGGVISENVGIDLTNTSGGYVEISFEEYLTTKPSEITYSFPGNGLVFKLFVNWAD